MADVQAYARDVVETIGARPGWIARQEVVASDFHGVTIIKTEIPTRQQITILHARSDIKSVCGRCKRITRSSKEAAQRERACESVAVVDQSDPG